MSEKENLLNRTVVGLQSSYESACEQIAALKAEIVNREGEKQEMREVIDRLRAENRDWRRRLAPQLYAEIAKLKEALESISELPCCENSKYPGCKACSAIDVIARSELQALLSGNGQQAGEDGSGG